MTASSKQVMANRIRRMYLSLLLPEFASCRMVSSSISHPSPWSSSNASTKSSRILPRSSSVAAVVNVTTRILETSRPCSATRRKKIRARAKVLPVPALASSKQTPSSKGSFAQSKESGLIALSPLFDGQVKVRKLLVQDGQRPDGQLDRPENR